MASKELRRGGVRINKIPKSVFGFSGYEIACRDSKGKMRAIDTMNFKSAKLIASKMRKTKCGIGNFMRK